MVNRKRICAFMGELSLDFQGQVCNIMNRLSKERNIDVVLFASFGSYIGPYGRNPFFEIGEKNIIHFPDFSVFDAILVFADTFDISGMDQELYDRIKKDAKCPVISVRNGSPDFPIVTIDNQGVFKAITDHFINEHGFKNICFMSGPLDLKDGLARYEGYVQAMKNAGLEIKRNFFFEGNYWRNFGVQAVDRFTNCPEEDFPEAIICANDYMALSVLEELKARGIKVPEQIAVSGFDNIDECTLVSPTLTTVEIVPEAFVTAAFDALEDYWNGIPVPKRIFVPYEMRLRQSCGCRPDVNTCFDPLLANSRIVHFDNIIRDNCRMVAEYQNSFAFDNTMVVATHYFGVFGCNKGYLCLCDENDPEYKSVEINKVYSDEMILKRIMYKDRRPAEIVDYKFPRRNVVPMAYYDDSEAHLTIVYTIHFRSKAYGYIALVPEIGEVPDLFTNIYLNSLASALESGYVEAQFLEMAEIQRMYLLDPLTGVYNRRGFEKEMQSIVNRVTVDGNEYISICSVDMDNLKQINDEHGHAEGDFAILALVKAINDCLEGKDFVARMGGDEFMVVLVGNDLDKHIEFKEKMEKTLVRVSVESLKPYKIHASIGISGPERVAKLDLYESMQIADEKMYANKKRYKSTLYN